MEIFENNMLCGCNDEDMVMPYPPMNGMPHPCPMPEPMPMPWPEPMPMPCPMPRPMPMPCPPMNGMPHPYPMPDPMPMPMPCPPMPMPCPPMHGMPHPFPMPMPVEECDEEMLHHMEKMYCMHMYMAAMNKTEAYRHKMMHCYCKHRMEDC
ncbi:hypothetical protein KQI88_12075 [Alkaliphilus sp. MSJ-5]|uniref:Uncharacterized protein n=1 Tax=Alkaliphilus flagellatus TaxID=2841507 RepID=A0ABS6G4P1_9FIRM|nr:hypothetical protein [Alkaliphilus flagellatus]MBU5677149.1 hypothetical protein [Alkaliphilus flagellatus]